MSDANVKPKKSIAFVDDIKDAASKPPLVFSEPTKIKNYSSLRQKIIRLSSSIDDEEGKIFLSFFDSIQSKYSPTERKKFYIAEGASIIYWACVKEDYTLKNLTSILEDMQFCDAIEQVFIKDKFAELISVLRGQLLMRKSNVLPVNIRNVLIAKMKILSNKSDAVKNFLQQNLTVYFSDQEIQRHFPALIANVGSLACQLS